MITFTLWLSIVLAGQAHIVAQPGFASAAACYEHAVQVSAAMPQISRPNAVPGRILSWACIEVVSGD